MDHELSVEDKFELFELESGKNLTNEEDSEFVRDVISSVQSLMDYFYDHLYPPASTNVTFI